MPFHDPVFRVAVAMVCMLALGSLHLHAQGPSSVEGARDESAAPSPVTPDPLIGTPQVSPRATGPYAKGEVDRMLPPRTDSPFDWQAGLEPLHDCGEPRWLPPCIPPPPCHPAAPPQPYDLIGARGMPTSGPRYRGPCCPRTGTHDDGPLPHVHRLHDRAFDWFYRTK